MQKKSVNLAQTDRGPYPGPIEIHFSVSISDSKISSFILEQIYCTQSCAFLECDFYKINPTKCQADVGHQSIPNLSEQKFYRI